MRYISSQMSAWLNKVLNEEMYCRADCNCVLLKMLVTKICTRRWYQIWYENRHQQESKGLNSQRTYSVEQLKVKSERDELYIRPTKEGSKKPGRMTSLGIIMITMLRGFWF